MRNVFLSLLLAETMTVSAQPVLPETLHTMPVLIQIPFRDNTNCNHIGTGIFLGESHIVSIVTAAHVLFNVYSTNALELLNSNAVLSYFKRANDSTTKGEINLNLDTLLDQGRIKRHSTHDVAAILLGFDNKTTETNGAWPFITFDGVNLNDNLFLSLNPTDHCKTLENIEDGSETYILGYPVDLLNNDLMHSEVDFSYPLIRKGIISQKNRKTGRLIIDSGVYGGNSGGPVIVVEHPKAQLTIFKVCGLVTQFVPVMTKIIPQVGVTNSDLVNSGYSVAEPIDYAIELLRQFGNFANETFSIQDTNNLIFIPVDKDTVKCIVRLSHVPVINTLSLITINENGVQQVFQPASASNMLYATLLGYNTNQLRFSLHYRIDDSATNYWQHMPTLNKEIFIDSDTAFRLKIQNIH